MFKSAAVLLWAAQALASSCPTQYTHIASEVAPYSEAQSYCSSHYPIPIATTTATASASTTTVTRTATTTAKPSTSMVYASTTRYYSTVTATITTSATTTTTSVQTDTTTVIVPPGSTSLAKRDDEAAAWSSITSKESSIIRTICSCIETTRTSTKTITPTVTATNTITSTVTPVSTITVTVIASSITTISTTTGTTSTVTVSGGTTTVSTTTYPAQIACASAAAATCVANGGPGMGQGCPDCVILFSNDEAHCAQHDFIATNCRNDYFDCELNYGYDYGCVYDANNPGHTGCQQVRDCNGINGSTFG